MYVLKIKRILHGISAIQQTMVQGMEGEEASFCLKSASVCVVFAS